MLISWFNRQLDKEPFLTVFGNSTFLVAAIFGVLAVAKGEPTWLLALAIGGIIAITLVPRWKRSSDERTKAAYEPGLAMSERTRGRIEALKETLDSDSMLEVIRRSVELLEILAERQRKGDKIKLRAPDCKERKSSSVDWGKRQSPAASLCRGACSGFPSGGNLC